MTDTRQLTVEEVARLLGASVPTVRRWAVEGRIPARKVGRQWLFDSSDLVGAQPSGRRTSPSTLDFASALGQLRHVDLIREVWVPDVVAFRDQLLAPERAVKLASNRIAGAELFDAAVEVEVPKGFFFSRSGLLLSLPDRIAYHAVVGSLAPAIEKGRIKDAVFSAALSPKVNELTRNGVELWLEWRAATEAAIQADQHCVIVDTDITAYFDSIQHRLLLEDVERLSPDGAIARSLRAMLSAWMPVRDLGIPQGPDASRLLGNMYLYPVDEAMVDGGWPYFRYMDDIRIVAPNRASAIEAIRTLEREIKKRGLNLSAQKTKLVDRAAALDDYANPDFGLINYLVDAGFDSDARAQSRRMLRSALGKGPGLRDTRKARFSLGRLQRLFDRKDRATVRLVLGRLEDLGQVAKIALQFLLPFLDRQTVREGLAEFVSDPARNYSTYLSTWILALMLEAKKPLPTGWISYARTVARDRNQPGYHRVLAANVLARSGLGHDISWLRRQIREDFDPSLVRGCLVALTRVSQLDKGTREVALKRFPGLLETIDYLQGRSSLPSLLYADRNVRVDS
jgi:excisionase family DNA binding protein